jgi:hypothetical protein
MTERRVPGDIGCPGLDDFHPACEVCGKYIFAVDCCKGHRDEEKDNE